ncbi:MAG: hypothetical protein ACLFST_15725 [Spirochaetia bacterium]
MKKLFLIPIALLLIISCSEPNSVFFVDPYLSEVLDSEKNIARRITGINRRYEEEIQVVPLDLNSSFTDQISAFLENNPFTVVFLGPFPGKTVPEISNSYPETLFTVIGADFNSLEENIVYVITDRTEAFRSAGLYARDYLDNWDESGSAAIGVYFTVDSPERERELQAFLEGAGEVVLHDFKGRPNRNSLLSLINADLAAGISLFLFACPDFNSFCLETALEEEGNRIITENWNSLDYFSENIIASIEENPYIGIEGMLMIRESSDFPKKIVVPAEVVDGYGKPLPRQKKD